MWKKLKTWMYEKYTDWQYANDLQFNPSGTIAFWYCVKWWWRCKPRLGKCNACETKLWDNGEASRTIYCSEECSWYGPYGKMTEDEIPF